MPKEHHTSSDRTFDDLARALAEGSISRRRALKLFVGSALAALIPSRALAQPKKVAICHKPGTPEEKTMEVPKSAVASHLGHGDRLGPCGTTTTTSTSTTSTSTSTSSTTSTTTSTSTTTPTSTTSTTSTTTPTTSTSTSTTSTSTTTPMCLPLGHSPCDADSECCSSICDQGFGSFFGTCATCRSLFDGCEADSECCSGICSLFSCDLCRQEGDMCTTDNDCCGGNICVNDSCQFP
jgi:hypothetical protein